MVKSIIGIVFIIGFLKTTKKQKVSLEENSVTTYYVTTRYYTLLQKTRLYYI